MFLYSQAFHGLLSWSSLNKLFTIFNFISTGFWVLFISADEDSVEVESAPINFQIVLFCWSLKFAGQKRKPKKMEKLQKFALTSLDLP